MIRRTSASVSGVEYMAPSSIHYIYADSTSARTSTDFRLAESDLDRTVSELTSSAGGLVQAHRLKIQIVEKDGNWFALNSAQLELCRRLEKGGVCPKVRVDIVPSNEVPSNVRNLMTLPPVTRTSSDEKRTPKTTATQKNAKPSSAASSTGGGREGALRGYQQLGQEEKENEDDDEEDEQEEEDEEEENKSPSDEEEEEAAAGDTDDGSVSDSDLEWSDEEVDSSEGEWSNIGSVGSCSETAELSSDDENNCLL